MSTENTGRSGVEILQLVIELRGAHVSDDELNLALGRSLVALVELRGSAR